LNCLFSESVGRSASPKPAEQAEKKNTQDALPFSQLLLRYFVAAIIVNTPEDRDTGMLNSE
jgi:hypothetical protein